MIGIDSSLDQSESEDMEFYCHYSADLKRVLIDITHTSENFDQFLDHTYETRKATYEAAEAIAANTNLLLVTNGFSVESIVRGFTNDDVCVYLSYADMSYDYYDLSK